MIELQEYKTGQSLSEARKKYGEVRKQFLSIKKRYSSWFKKPQDEISYEDARTLKESLATLMSLENLNPVRREFLNSEDSNNTLMCKISDLNGDILAYLAGFRNSGITKEFREI